MQLWPVLDRGLSEDLCLRHIVTARRAGDESWVVLVRANVGPIVIQQKLMT